jgi:ethanolamine ammonia-lyase small subunit
MPGGSDDELAFPDLPDLLRKVRARTPARLLAGRAGAAYRTETQIDLREAHAAAQDAVRIEFEIEAAFGSTFVRQWGLFEVCTQADSKDAYLLRPDLGRHFNDASSVLVRDRCSPSADLQIVIGDGLSVSAVSVQVPVLLPLLKEGAKALGWTFGQPFAIRHCRVGILNKIGVLLAPRVAVLLIGERPGLATAESLSAYMAYRPRPNDSDANRNLISNIHPRGVNPPDAASRILKLAAQMVNAGLSGYAVREE